MFFNEIIMRFAIAILQQYMRERKKYTYKDPDFNVEDLLNEVFKPQESLKELFQKRLDELGISPTNALDILKISYRALNGILNGDQKNIDITNLGKIAAFLQMRTEDVIKLYLSSFERNHPKEEIITSKKIEFIKENFDLASLKKAGFIDSIVDFSQIDKKITSFLGLKSIFEYRKPEIEVAFSAGKVKPKNLLNRSLWDRKCKNCI